ncbi:hypothetical protein Aple_040000 [Acrocarpospora pleiomorpha]|uniref:Uncharacterized protein n=1 Tax=Acrocarpospora pleiomorpha TaxID=90975 RepID=A0A5M3XIP4_9ACTN|nr:hypothetical protein Aple_040000 [Acrocarpospora pleiomorpha]
MAGDGGEPLIRFQDPQPKDTSQVRLFIPPPGPMRASPSSVMVRVHPAAAVPFAGADESTVDPRVETVAREERRVRHFLWGR